MAELFERGEMRDRIAHSLLGENIYDVGNTYNWISFPQFCDAFGKRIFLDNDIVRERQGMTK
jgi:hypothetical protein